MRGRFVDAGIGHVMSHMFRTTMATDLVNAGTHPFVTQQLLDPQTTRRYYRFNLKQSREAIDRGLPRRHLVQSK